MNQCCDCGTVTIYGRCPIDGSSHLRILSDKAEWGYIREGHDGVNAADGCWQCGMTHPCEEPCEAVDERTDEETYGL